MEGRAAPMMSAIPLVTISVIFFRIGEASHAQHRLFCDLLDEAGPGDLMTLLVEPRWPGVLAPLGDVADVHVPQVPPTGQPGR